jgi:hypothetical protein
MKKTSACLIVIVTVIAISMFSLPVHGGQVFSLENQVNPQALEADNNRLYVSAGTTVSIYWLKDFKLIKQFGQEGSGPGEFQKYFDTGVGMKPNGKNLAVISPWKISLYTKSGRFVSEKRATAGYFHIPFGEGYVGMRTKQKEKTTWRTVNIYDKDFNLVKEIAQKKHFFNRNKSVDPVNVRVPMYHVYKNRVYSENQQGTFDVFDAKGNRLFTFGEEIKRRKVSDEDKKNYHDYYKTHPQYKPQYHALKHLLKFPENYPRARYFDVKDGHVYVFTYINKNGQSELLIYNLDGKLKRTVYIDMPEINPQVVFPLVTVKNNKVYQMIENEDTEEFELHVTDIPR